MASKPFISTHILDTTRGRPASDVEVTLFQLTSDKKWNLVKNGLTNTDGRFADFVNDKSTLSIGKYKIHFNVEEYFAKLQVDAFYPFVEIVFEIRSMDEHYHVPLLLNPFGYSTYRGS